MGDVVVNVKLVSAIMSMVYHFGGMCFGNGARCVWGVRDVLQVLGSWHHQHSGLPGGN
jgi:hypothetical protein